MGSMKALAQEAESISIGLSDFFGHPESEWDYYKKDNPEHVATNGTVIHTHGKDIFVYNKGTCDICECDFSETFFPDCECYEVRTQEQKNEDDNYLSHQWEEIYRKSAEDEVRDKRIEEVDKISKMLDQGKLDEMRKYLDVKRMELGIGVQLELFPKEDT